MSRSVRRSLLYLMVVAVGFLGLVRLLTKDSVSFHDFSLYWYAGQLIWQGSNPYVAHLEQVQPALPISYLDGVILATGPVHPFNPKFFTPAYPAPVLLLLAPLARFSWPTATLIWLLINVGLVVVVAWAIARLFERELRSPQGVLMLVLFASLIATRQTLQYGQGALLYLACMLLALIAGQRHQWLAGLLLGMAMSKYSLAWPMLMVFLYQRWYQALAGAALVQLLGALVLAALTRTPVLHIFFNYYQMLLLVTNEHGFELASSLLAGWGRAAQLLLLLGSLALGLALWRWYRAEPARPLEQSRMPGLTLLSTLMMYNLLIMYHRQYDHIVNILFLALVLLGADAFVLSARQRRWLYALALLLAAFWIMPVALLTGAWGYRMLANIATIVALLSSLWLLFRLRDTSATTRRLAPLWAAR